MPVPDDAADRRGQARPAWRKPQRVRGRRTRLPPAALWSTGCPDRRTSRLTLSNGLARRVVLRSTRGTTRQRVRTTPLLQPPVPAVDAGVRARGNRSPVRPACAADRAPLGPDLDGGE